MTTQSRQAQLFLSYAHEDKLYLEQLQEHLAGLKRRGLIKAWSDHAIKAGSDWSPEIQRQLDAAHVIVLLVSSSFLASDYCYDKEMARALDRLERGEAKVIPVLVRPADWEETPLKELLAVPAGGPITSSTDPDAAWVEVAKAIGRVVEEALHDRLEHAADSWARWPRPHTSLLVGRDEELGQVRGLLSAGHRLVSLVGPAGVGKTHLALHAGHLLQDIFTGGGYRVSLSQTSDPVALHTELARALRVRDGSGRLADRIAEHIGEKRLLILLDGFEHLTEATTQLCDLLDHCPGLTLFVTSRQALDQDDQHVVCVEPLPVPSRSEGVSAQDLAGCPSVVLFQSTALATGRRFVLDDDNAPAVARLCQQLEGLPQALEITARNVTWLSPQQMLDRLPELLEPMAKVVATSVDSLEMPTQRLFADLSVFVGGCTLEAAEGVFGRDRQVFQRLKELIRKNLLRSFVDAGAFRYEMLGPIREQANARLAPQELPQVQRRHADYYRELAETAEPRIEGAEQRQSLDLLEAEHENINAVLGRVVEGSVDAETGLRLAGALGPLWYVRGRFTEARHWLERLLALDADVSAPVRAKALVLAGIMTYHQCDYREAEELLEQGRDLFLGLDDDAETTHLLRDLHLQAKEEGVAKALNCLGFVSKEQGEYDESVRLYEESLRLYREVGDDWGVAQTATDFALALVAQDDVNADRAVALLQESLDHYAEGTGQPSGQALSLLYLGYARLAQGSVDEAAELAEQSLSQSRQLGYGRGVSLAAHFAGLLHLTGGRPGHALPLFREALAARKEQGDKAGVAESLDGLAAARADAGQPEGGARLLGRADKTWEALGGRRTHAEYATAASVLGERLDALRERDLHALKTGGCTPLEQLLAELDA